MTAALSPASVRSERARDGPALKNGFAISDPASLTVLVAAGLAVGAVTIRLGLVDPFLLFRLARVEAWFNAGGFVPYSASITAFDGSRPLYELTLAGVGMATGLSPFQIAILPVGAILLPIACYALCKQLFHDGATALLLALAFLFNHSFASDYLGTFVYVWSTLLFLTFLIALWKVITDGKSPPLIAALVGLFLVTEGLYQTTATWMVFALAATAGLSWLLRLRGHSVNRDAAMPVLALALAGYFLYFDSALYASFLDVLGRSGASTQLTNAIDALLAQLTLALSPIADVPAPYRVVAVSSPIAPLVVISQYALIATAVAIWIVTGMRHPRADWSTRGTMLVALMIGAVFHTAAYLFVGAFNPRLFGLLGGVIGALALADAGAKWGWIRGWCLGLAAISLIGMVAFLGRVPRAPSQDATDAAANWMLAQEREPAVTADLGLYGRMLVTAAAQGRTLRFVNLDSCGFAHLVESSPRCGPDSLGDYVVIEQANLSSPLKGLDWRGFGPPGRYWSEILGNPLRVVAYSEDGIVILRRSIH